MSIPSPSSIASFRQVFERFAENECKDRSPLYYGLCLQIAADEELLEYGSFLREGQPLPNSFLASVHYLVLKNPQVALAAHYPSVTGRKSEAIPFDLFKAFVRQHREELAALMGERIVQTNVLTRCNYLLPAFSSLLAGTDDPVTLIDIGTSAGLTLNFDRYEYYYNDEKVYGSSSVQLHCQVREGRLPPVQPIRNRMKKIGIDQHIADLTNEDEQTWLKALIWPDQMERFTQLQEALRLPALSEIRLFQGSTIAEFRERASSVDPSDILILYSTHVLYQFPESLLSDFYSFLDDLGRQRDFFFLSAEATRPIQDRFGVRNTAVVLTAYQNGAKEEKLLAETNGHGNWLKWMG